MPERARRARGRLEIAHSCALSFGLAAVAGRLEYGFLGMAVDLAGLGAALALSNIFTVMLAYPMVKRAGSPLAQASQGYLSYGFVGVLGNLACVSVGASAAMGA